MFFLKNLALSTVFSAAILLSSAAPASCQSLTQTDFSRPSSKKTGLLTVPKAVAGVATGVMLGVPVNISKSTKRFTGLMYDSISANFSFSAEPDLYARTTASVLAVPFGLMSGLVFGTIKGVENGVLLGGEKPFSKESFSMDAD